MLITRRDVELGLHRRRVAGELTELRSVDLRFTLAETRELLERSGIGLSDQALTRLHERAEGWVAGLRLAALALQGHPDPERFVAEFSGSERTVADYLIAEVLDAQPAHIRRLLERASLLEWVNGELGDLLTGGSGAERDLRTLADAGGFVVPLDFDGSTFRFHHLFADLLAVRLRHTEPEKIPGLHLCAATWYAEHGHVVEAITHAEAAGEREHAAGLLIKHYFSLTFDGRGATARALLRRFAADPALVESPEILVAIAAEELTDGSLDQADAYLNVAELHAGSVPPDRRHRFDLALLVTRLSLTRRRGDFRSVAAGAASTLQEPVSSDEVVMHADVRALTLMNLGIVQTWSGQVDEGARHLEQAGRLAQEIHRPYLQVACLAHWGQALSWHSFTRARAVCRDAVELAESRGWGADPVIGPAVVTLGVALVHAGRLDEAEQCLARADQVLQSNLEPAVGVLLQMARSGVHWAQGRYLEALAGFRVAERLALLLSTDLPLAAQLRCSILVLMLRSGDAAAVHESLAQITQTERDSAEVREVIAALALAEGDAAAAVDVLAPTLDGTAPAHHEVVVVRSLLLEALAREALGAPTAAEEAVERALGVAERDALISPFLMVQAGALLDRHPRHRTAHAAFHAEILDGLSGHVTSSAGARLGEPLTELSGAERRVLRFLPTNLSAAAIADQTFVSVNTVKSMRHIYAKLDAHSRVEAVQRARELGLLGRSGRGEGAEPPAGRRRGR